MAPDSVQMPASVNNGPNCEQAYEKQTPNNSGGASRKKKVNRSAKLKQYKLDARREQWLSQGKNKGPAKHNGDLGPLSDVNKVGVNHVESTMYSEMDSRSPKSSIGEDNEGSSLQESDNEFAFNSPQNAPRKEANIQGQQRPGSSSSSCSGFISEDEDGSLDDWEAVADALNLNEDSLKLSREKVREEIPSNAQFQTNTGYSTEAENKGIVKPEDKIKPILIPTRVGRTGNGRAWRPDDVSRPVSLPSLSKQHSFPTQSGRLSTWGSTNRNEPSIPSAIPPSCPICYEDLDATDSNFVPCACGFHLCLFCHKRIVEQDGRCPSCRNQYAPIDVGINVSVFSRLSRSCSMISSA
jgi:hypothetical protein